MSKNFNKNLNSNKNHKQKLKDNKVENYEKYEYILTYGIILLLFAFAFGIVLIGFYN